MRISGSEKTLQAFRSLPAVWITQSIDSLGTHERGFGAECLYSASSWPRIQAKWRPLAAKASCRPSVAGCRSGSLPPAICRQGDLCQGLVAWTFWDVGGLRVGRARYPLCFTATTERARPHHLRVCNVGLLRAFGDLSFIILSYKPMELMEHRISNTSWSNIASVTLETGRFLAN